mgnify:CR=1 FL=1
MIENEFLIRKIVNDPVYGFINLPAGIVYDIIEHPYFQRLRRIKQLGLTNLVYPGANHSRLQHAMGAFYLMGQAIDVIRSKGHHISHDESEAVMMAILLHDAGHGPYSHTLENSIITGVNHENISVLFMEEINRQLQGKLDLAIRIFKNQYSKKFLHQLVSSQLDMDRLDYLKRDSFFTGVSEGVISSDRIIKMLNVVNDQLVVDEKGIYSIEKFLVARRLMYWQVYWHKTVLAAEQMLVHIFKRARELNMQGNEIFATPALKYFLSRAPQNENVYLPGAPETLELLNHFALLDDYDVMTSIKVWASHPDKVLSRLCQGLMNRKLLHITIQKDPVNLEMIKALKEKMKVKSEMLPNELEYFVFTGNIQSNAYSNLDDRIQILYKNGELKDVAEASDMLNISVLSKMVRKYFVCFPKDLKLN